MGDFFTTIARGVGAVVKAQGTIIAGKEAESEGQAQQAALNYQAGVIRQQAGQTVASSQRQAAEVRRREDLVQSRVRAVAGASGAGSTDPTVLNLQGQIAGRGEYEALSALFNGEERARGLDTAATLREYEGAEALRMGKLRRTLSNVDALGTIVSAGNYSGGTASSTGGGGSWFGGGTMSGGWPGSGGGQGGPVYA